MFPSHRHHPTEPSRIVTSQEEADELGEDWKLSPADHGIETAPGSKPDPDIAANNPRAKKKKNAA